MRARRGGGLIAILIVVVVVLLSDGAEPRDDRAPQPQPRETARGVVDRVVDGDTIKVELEDSSTVESVRYIGVDTPETVKPGTPVQCFGEQASELNGDLVAGEVVELQFDQELRDRYGRLLAYVFVGETLINAELLRRGYARTLEIEPNTSRAERFARLELEAGEAGRGLWSAC
jgi:micrococcal nuclease